MGTRPVRADESLSVKWEGDDAALLKLAREQSADLPGAVYDRFGTSINTLVWRLLGADDEHDDMVHQVFIEVLRGLKKVREPQAMRAWVESVTINTIRSHLRKRSVRRIVQSADPSVVDERFASGWEGDTRLLLSSTYAILDRMPANERIAFVLRFVEQRSLAEVAQACDCSLATVKRWLTKAERRFKKMALLDANLHERAQRSPRGC